MIDKLKARAAAFETVLKGGVPIEGDTEEDEVAARLVYDWLVSQKEEADRMVERVEAAA